MGMIAAVTPGMKQIHKLVPRVNVTTEDITSIGHVSIKHFKPQGDNFRLLSYKGPHLFMLMIQHHLLTHCGKDPCPFRPRGLVGLEWCRWCSKVTMLGRHSVFFLPMIDLNPSVYSTLNFICEHAMNNNVTATVVQSSPSYSRSTSTIVENHEKLYPFA